MNKPPLLAAIALSAAALSSCNTPAGPAAAQGLSDYGAEKYISAAKTATDKAQRVADLDSAIAFIQEVETAGLSAKAFQDLTAKRFASKPEIRVLLNVAISYGAGGTASGPVSSAYLDAVLVGFRQARAIAGVAVALPGK